MQTAAPALSDPRDQRLPADLPPDVPTQELVPIGDSDVGADGPGRRGGEGGSQRCRERGAETGADEPVERVRVAGLAQRAR